MAEKNRISLESDLTCQGCGVKLQDSDENRSGFIKRDFIEREEYKHEVGTQAS